MIFRGDSDRGGAEPLARFRLRGTGEAEAADSRRGARPARLGHARPHRGADTARARGGPGPDHSGAAPTRGEAGGESRRLGPHDAPGGRGRTAGAGGSARGDGGRRGRPRDRGDDRAARGEQQRLRLLRGSAARRGTALERRAGFSGSSDGTGPDPSRRAQPAGSGGRVRGSALRSRPRPEGSTAFVGERSRRVRDRSRSGCRPSRRPTGAAHWHLGRLAAAQGPNEARVRMVDRAGRCTASSR